jgi:hypothetical protein
MLSLAFGLALGLAGTAVAQKAPLPLVPDGEIVEYAVRPGDTLYTLASAYFLRLEDYRIVQKLNRVANPRRLPIGSILRIPRPLLRTEPIPARVLAFRGDVQIVRGAKAGPAEIGAVAGEGDKVVTGRNAFVSFGLPDRSVIALPSQSQVRIARLRRVLLTGAQERRFEIEQGRARGTITPQRRRGDDFRFATPSAVSAVRGTELQVGYDAGKSITEVFEGTVGVAAGAQPAETVHAGFGAVRAGEGPLSSPRALLPAPELQAPDRLQNARDLSFAITPLPGALRYRVRIARDAGFLDTREEVETGETAVLPAVDDGSWFVRIAGLDAEGLEGMPRTYSFRRRLNALDTQTVQPEMGPDGIPQYRFQWTALGIGTFQFRLQLTSLDKPEVPIVDEPGLTASAYIVRNLAPGRYRWRLMTLQFVDGEINRNWSAFEELTISAGK